MVIKGVNILIRIRKSKLIEDDMIMVVDKMKKAKVKVLRDKDWRKEDGLILKNRKVYMLKDEELRVEVI